MSTHPFFDDRNPHAVMRPGDDMEQRLSEFLRLRYMDVLAEEKVPADDPRFEQGRHAVACLSVTDDGRFTVVGDTRGTISVWSNESGTHVRNCVGHTAQVTCLDVKADGRFLVSGSSDNTVRIWNLESGKCLKDLPGHGDTVTGVKWAVGEDRVISTSQDGSLRVWDLTTGLCERVLEGESEPIISMDFSTERDLAVTVDANGQLLLWPLAWEPCKPRIVTEDSNIRCVRLSRDGRIALTGDSDGTVGVWSLESRKCVRTLPGHSKRVSAIHIDDVGHWAITGSWDGAIRLWNLIDGRCARILVADSDVVETLSATSDCRMAVIAGLGEEISVLNLETGNRVRRYSVTPAMIANPGSASSDTPKRENEVYPYSIRPGAGINAPGRNSQIASRQGAFGRYSGLGVAATSSSVDVYVTRVDNPPSDRHPATTRAATNVPSMRIVNEKVGGEKNLSLFDFFVLLEPRDARRDCRAFILSRSRLNEWNSLELKRNLEKSPEHVAEVLDAVAFRYVRSEQREQRRVDGQHVVDRRRESSIIHHLNCAPQFEGTSTADGKLNCQIAIKTNLDGRSPAGLLKDYFVWVIVGDPVPDRDTNAIVEEALGYYPLSQSDNN